MPATTPTYGFPYPESSDPPNGPGQIGALAQAVETEIERADADLVDAVGEIGQTATSYLPVLTASTTNPGLGIGAVREGWYTRVGKLIIGGFRIEFGSGSAPGNGSYRVTLPTNADTSVLDTSGNPATASVIGSAMISDSSDSSERRPGSLALVGAGLVIIGTTSSNGTVWHSTPWTWDDGDAISGSFIYLGT